LKEESWSLCAYIRTPIHIDGLTVKNTIVGKYRGKAATATNKQFGAMAGVARRKML